MPSSVVPGSTSISSPPGRGCRSLPVSSPNWRRFRRWPGRRSAVTRARFVLQYVDAVPDDFEVCSGNDVESGDFAAPEQGDLRGPGPGRAGRARHRRGNIALLKAGLSLQGLPAVPTRVALDQRPRNCTPYAQQSMTSPEPGECPRPTTACALTAPRSETPAGDPGGVGHRVLAASLAMLRCASGGSLSCWAVCAAAVRPR